MRIVIILGILGIAIGGAIAMTKMRPEPPKKERVNLDPLVEVIVLESMTANFEVTSQGTVRPRTETVLSSEVTGTVTSISPQFVAGGVFKSGETLMRIDPVNYQVALKQAEALLAQRQIEYEGAKKLRSQGYRAESEFASATAALATAESEQVRAQRNLERTYVHLPYEGMVRAKDADLGQFVNPGTRLGVTFATDFAEIRLPLTDLDLAFVEIPTASNATISGDAVGPAVVLGAVQKGQPLEWQAQIVRTEGVVDEKSRVTYAVAEVADPYRLHNSGDVLPMGTFVAASIQGSSAANIFRVPRSVVRGSDELVFVDDENLLRIRRVQIVRSDTNYVYIQSGVAAGERVVLTALESPVNGMPVRVANSGPLAAEEVSD